MPIEKARKLEQLRPKLENGLKRGLILAGKLVSQRATGKAPRLTGRLKRSIHEGLPYAIGMLAWAIDVGTNVEYAAAQEFGVTTKAHPISARFKKVLSFEWPEAPAEVRAMFSKTFPRVFFRQVMHPGSKIPAHPYLWPALRESRGEIRRLLLGNVTAAIRRK